jgi:hypothetical protein
MDSLLIAGAAFLAASVALGLLVYSFIAGVAPVPTTPKVTAKILGALSPDLEGNIFELGSGWGTLAYALAKRFPACTVIAYEISPIPWFICKLRLALFPQPNVILRRADFHTASLDQAAAIVCFLFPGCMKKLGPKLQKELLPGAQVVSHTWPVPGWQPEAVHQAGDWHSSRVYAYVAPPRHLRHEAPAADGPVATSSRPESSVVEPR